MTAKIEIEEIYGNCPVQAEGTIDGKRFYFRARGEHWRIEIHPTAAGNYLDWDGTYPSGKPWSYTEEWPGGMFAAGWMSTDDARRMIEKAAELYRMNINGGSK